MVRSRDLGLWKVPELRYTLVIFCMEVEDRQGDWVTVRRQNVGRKCCGVRSEDQLHCGVGEEKGANSTSGK